MQTARQRYVMIIKTFALRLLIMQIWLGPYTICSESGANLTLGYNIVNTYFSNNIKWFMEVKYLLMLPTKHSPHDEGYHSVFYVVLGIRLILFN